MNKMTLGIIAVVILAGGAFILSRQSPPSKDSMMADPTPTYSETMQTTDEAMDKSGSYIPYSPEILADASANKRVLFFFANWCPTCKSANAAFETGPIPSGITVIRVNYNDTDTDQEEKNLAQQYAVTYQHTYVQIDAEGNEVTRWTGGRLQELKENVK